MASLNVFTTFHRKPSLNNSKSASFYYIILTTCIFSTPFAWCKLNHKMTVDSFTEQQDNTVDSPPAFCIAKINFPYSSQFRFLNILPQKTYLKMAGQPTNLLQLNLFLVLSSKQIQLLRLNTT